MSFIDICWLIVKICAGIIGLCLAVGFTSKQIAKNRQKQFDNEHKERKQ